MSRMPYIYLWMPIGWNGLGISHYYVCAHTHWESLVKPRGVKNMEYFEGEALHSTSTPRYWFKFADDTFVIQQQSHKQLFLDHINSLDPAIKFTVEGNQENGAIPFLDTLVKPEADNFLSISVYYKPTYTDLQGHPY